MPGTERDGKLEWPRPQPLQPLQRGQRRVALRGVADGGTTTFLAWERADDDDVLTAVAPSGFNRFALALFSPRHLLDPGTAFPFSVGSPPPAARPAAVVITEREPRRHR